MSKHTKGPWCFDHNGAGDDKTACIEVNAFEPNGQYRGQIACLQSAEHIGGITCVEAEANARLICAAPDLLAALVCLLRVDDEWHGSVNSEMAEARQSARAAIAKARGDL